MQGNEWIAKRLPGGNPGGGGHPLGRGLIDRRGEEAGVASTGSFGEMRIVTGWGPSIACRRGKRSGQLYWLSGCVTLSRAKTRALSDGGNGSTRTTRSHSLSMLVTVGIAAGGCQVPFAIEPEIWGV